MKLVQILLPLKDNSGKPFPETVLRKIQQELCDKFGGMTAYNRAPAEGIWRTVSGQTEDDIVILEVMVPDLDKDWWQGFRQRLEEKLGQEELIIRSQTIEKL